MVEAGRGWSGSLPCVLRLHSSACWRWVSWSAVRRRARGAIGGLRPRLTYAPITERRSEKALVRGLEEHRRKRHHQKQRREMICSFHENLHALSRNGFCEETGDGSWLRFVRGCGLYAIVLSAFVLLHFEAIAATLARAWLQIQTTNALLRFAARAATRRDWSVSADLVRARSAFERFPQVQERSLELPSVAPNRQMLRQLAEHRDRNRVLELHR